MFENLKYRKYPTDEESVEFIKQTSLEDEIKRVTGIKDHNLLVIEKRFKIFGVVYWALFLTVFIVWLMGTIELRHIPGGKWGLHIKVNNEVKK